MKRINSLCPCIQKFSRVAPFLMHIVHTCHTIRELAKHTASSGPLVGVGTVLNVDAARRCLDAGAQFLVSPGFNPSTVELTGREGKLMMAGR